LPAFAYAMWSVPNEVAQRERFGQTLLTGQPLLEYCLWRGGLTAEESAAWDKQLADCQPGNLKEKLSSFPQLPREQLEAALKARAPARKP